MAILWQNSHQITIHQIWKSRSNDRMVFCLRIVIRRLVNYLTTLVRSYEFFHNSRLIRRIQQNKIYKKFRDLTRNWTQITCLTVRHLNHYTKLFSVLVWGYNWILFMLGWLCPIRLIHLIGRIALHFEKTRLIHQPCLTQQCSFTKGDVMWLADNCWYCLLRHMFQMWVGKTELCTMQFTCFYLLSLA